MVTVSIKKKLTVVDKNGENEHLCNNSSKDSRSLDFMEEYNTQACDDIKRRVSKKNFKSSVEPRAADWVHC